MTRIIEKIKLRRRQRLIHNQDTQTSHDDINNKELTQISNWYYSFEFFPPKTEFGLDNLLARIERMSHLNPLFMDITWGASGSTSARSMQLASFIQRYCGVDALLHITCTGMTREQIALILQQARSCGIQNILALRGDAPKGLWAVNDISGGYCHRSIDLIKLIKELHGDFFGICVAGFPESHPSSVDRITEMHHMKEKIDAGADFIITQFFYNVDIFHEFVRSCRLNGIFCPIIPGIFPIQSYNNFIRMTEFCCVSVPSHILKRLECVKDDMEAVKKIGNEIATEMTRDILTSPQSDVDGVHFHTLNLERSVTMIMAALLKDKNEDIKTQKNGMFSINLLTRQFPWRQSAMERRKKEDVRPIHWANRPMSYVLRTEDWEEYPNGRWGNASSPAFGAVSELSYSYSFAGSDEDRREMLGNHPTFQSQIFEVFAKYVEGAITNLPWCDTPLRPESAIIGRALSALNRAGYLTINSQPSVNGKASDHQVFGWGGPGGYIYQKGYCECFVSPERAQKLVSIATNHKHMSLFGVNNQGEELRVQVLQCPAALTWGIFPCREIQQPTIFDPSTFLVWAEEAFMLWTTMWLNLYDDQSESYRLIEEIRDSYYLVAIIDNEFVDDNDGGSLWKALQAEVGTVDMII